VCFNDARSASRITGPRTPRRSSPASGKMVARLAQLVSQGLATYTGHVTTKERLHQLVEQLSDGEATAALALLQGQLADIPGSAPLPEFFGTLHSGKGDLADRSSDILQAEFGRS
jgi:hypothetical protein